MRTDVLQQAQAIRASMDAAAGAAQIGKAEPVATAEERIVAAEAQIQDAMTEIEKAKNDLSDVQIIKNSLGLEENG